MNERKANLPLGIAGAGIGAIIGFMLFFVMTKQGLYALALPGAAVGLTCGWLSGGRSTLLGLICCVIAAALGLVIEWKFRPFKADGSFTYFVLHLHQLNSRTWIMLILGAVFGFWFGIGRSRDIGFAERPRTAIMPDVQTSHHDSSHDQTSYDADSANDGIRS